MFPSSLHHHEPQRCACRGKWKDEVRPKALSLGVLVGLNMATGEGGISTSSSKRAVSKVSKVNAPCPKSSPLHNNGTTTTSSNGHKLGSLPGLHSTRFSWHYVWNSRCSNTSPWKKCSQSVKAPVSPNVAIVVHNHHTCFTTREKC